MSYDPLRPSSLTRHKLHYERLERESEILKLIRKTNLKLEADKQAKRLKRLIKK